MADSIAAPQLKRLVDFRHRIPGHIPGTETHRSTLIRWCVDGVRTPDGRRVKLRAVRVGSRWFSTDTWFDAFLAQQGAADAA